MKSNKLKWIHGALPAILIHANIGSVYCWSLLKAPIAESLGVNISEISIAFSLAIFFLGMSAAFGGGLVEKNIIRSTLLSAICYGSGLVLSALGIIISTPFLVILGYGVLMGIGLGLGYLSPIKTLILWFKEHPGLATGLAIGGFGLSKVIYSPLLEYLLNSVGITSTLLVMATIGSICGILASFLINKPENWEKDVKIKFNAFQILKNPDYIKIWLVFFLNITCGIALISYESYIGTMSGLSNAALLLAITAVFNTMGRIIYPALPITKKSLIFILILSTSLIASIYGSMTPRWIIMGIILCVINAGYGGMFSTMPILLKERFGLGTLSTIHGVALSAWAWAGIAGNILAEYVIGTYGLDDLFLTLGALYFIALILICSLKKEA